NIFLVDRCPNCNSQIPIVRSSFTQCPDCSIGDYRRAHHIGSREGSFFHIGQELMMHHLTAEGKRQNSTMVLLAGSPLLELTSRDYFLLFRAFLSTLARLLPEDPFLQVDPEIRSQLRRKIEDIFYGFTICEWVALTATFHYIFASWPRHFFA